VARIWRFLWCCVLLSGALPAQQPKPPEPQEPPEEDEALTVKEYSFNPLQAEKELKIGNFYFKKGSYRAAARRFQEATKWNPGFAEAYFRLAETQEKLKDQRAAQQSYTKFLELAPEDKRVPEVRKRVSRKVAKSDANHAK
jgi:tetratricopeptide (TPR) repeat protein